MQNDQVTKPLWIAIVVGAVMGAPIFPVALTILGLNPPTAYGAGMSMFAGASFGGLLSVVADRAIELWRARGVNS
jgi:hypothetical protein